jgi:hypothetical protein
MSKMHFQYSTLYRSSQNNVIALSNQLDRIRKEANLLVEEKNGWRKEEKRLVREVERLEGLVRKMMDECNLARGVRVRMQWENGQLKEEVESLRKVVPAGGGGGGSGVGAGVGGAGGGNAGTERKELPSEVVDAIRKEMSEKLEIQVASRAWRFLLNSFSFLT